MSLLLNEITGANGAGRVGCQFGCSGPPAWLSSGVKWLWTRVEAEPS